MLEDGLNYPRRGDWVKLVLIGGIMWFLGFLIIPMFLVYGYLLKIVDDTLEGVDEPPEWDDWGDLLVNGLLAWVIGLIYSIPVLLVAFIVFVMVVGLGAATEDPAAAFVGVGLLGLLAIFILSIVIAYVLPAALINFVREGRAGAAFSFGTIRQVAFTKEYLTGIVLSIVVWILISIVSTIVSITVIGVLLIPFIAFYGYMVAARILANGFDAAYTANIG